MTVVRCDASHAARWDAFVARSTAASFYHRFAWKAINEEMFGHRTAYLAVLADDGGIAGVYPLVQVKSRLFGNIACSMPFVNYGGPAADAADAERLLMEEAARVCAEWNVDFLEIRSRHHLGDGLPASAHKVSMTLDLAPDPDTLWNAFKTGHRQEIRRGYKHGLTARVGGREMVDEFFEVLEDSWRHLGTPLYAKSYFERIADDFGKDIRITVVYAGDRPAGAAFDGLHGKTVEGMWLGSRAEYRHWKIGYVLYWELIKEACTAGYTRFHLGRSSVDSGGEAFKKKWNAESMPLYWHYLLRHRKELPQVNVNNPKYELAIQVWKELPLAVIRRVGPRIARCIP